MGIQEFIESTLACNTEEEIFACYEHSMKQFGLDRICYSLMTDHPSLERKSGHGVLKNYPDDWMSHYMAEGYPDLDPVRRFVMATPIAFRWDELPQLTRLNKKEKLVMNEAREACLHDGIAVPLFGPVGEVAGVGMAGTTPGIDLHDSIVCEISLLTHQFHQAYSLLYRKNKHGKASLIKLSTREREVLLWAFKGKTNWEIGEILVISETTVKTYFKRIQTKLNTTSRIAAISKAIYLGLIYP